jgi:integrase
VSIQARTLGNGKTVYDVQVRVESRDAKGIRRKITRTVRTLNEARRIEARLKVEAELGSVLDSKRTVGDLLDAWLKAGTWSPTTRYGYVRIIEREIRPHLGSVKLSRLGPQHLDGLYGDMRDEGHAGNSIRNVHRVLTAALNRAVKWGWLAFSPAARATLGPILGGVGRVATESEVKSLIAAATAGIPARAATATTAAVPATAPDPALAFAIRLACATGLRRSELAGLLWSDVDFTANTITVQRATVDAGGKTHEKGTKTSNNRTVPLGASMVAMLKERRGIGPVLGASPRVLSNRLRALADDVKIEGDGFGWHAFRHYAGTELAGVTDLRTVADILGHSTLRTTEKYVHAKEERSRAAVDDLDALLG